jgi:hypothetical protein
MSVFGMFTTPNSDKLSFNHSKRVQLVCPSLSIKLDSP